MVKFKPWRKFPAIRYVSVCVCECAWMPCVLHTCTCTYSELAPPTHISLAEPLGAGQVHQVQLGDRVGYTGVGPRPRLHV